MRAALQTRLIVIATPLCMFTVVHVINALMGGSLSQYGINPRSVDSIWTIATAPFLHSSWQHLLNNIWAFVVFSALTLRRPVPFYLFASLFIVLFSGLCVWALGREAYHLGASGWVYGLWGLSMAMAWFERSLKSILIATLVAFLYGGMAWELFRFDESISFEGHIGGVVAGVIFALIYRKTQNTGMLSNLK